MHSAPVIDQDADAVSEAVARLVAAVNQGQFAEACASFTDDAVIVEDIAPYRWHGPGAAEAWLIAMGQNAQKLGVTAVAMDLEPALRIEVQEGRAYAVYPGVLSLEITTGSLTADGQLTLTLVESSDAWLIQTLVWTGPAPAPR